MAGPQSIAVPILSSMCAAGYATVESLMGKSIKDAIVDNWNWGACCKPETYQLAHWVCSKLNTSIAERLSICLDIEDKVQNWDFSSQVGAFSAPFVLAFAVSGATYWYISSRKEATVEERRPVIQRGAPSTPSLFRKIADIFSSKFAQASYGVLGLSSCIFRLVSLNNLLSSAQTAGRNTALNLAPGSYAFLKHLFIGNYAVGPFMIIAIGVANAYNYTKKPLPPPVPEHPLPDVAAL